MNFKTSTLHHCNLLHTFCQERTKILEVLEYLAAFLNDIIANVNNGRHNSKQINSAIAFRPVEIDNNDVRVFNITYEKVIEKFK